MKIITGGIAAAKGFQAVGVACGIKKKKKDLALIVSSRPCSAAGVFTTNVVKAAPVVWDKAIIDAGGPVHAIVVNSGNANACTGARGMIDAQATAAHAASALESLELRETAVSGMKAENILVCSTGVIGVPLPMDRLLCGITAASAMIVSGSSSAHSTDSAASAASADDAAHAILTTDTTEKVMAVSCEIGGKTVTIGGMAKGSGMIHPNLATMLAFITTDAGISTSLLQELLGDSIADTFNMISVDGDTSTNDTVLVLANGASGVVVEKEQAGWDEFSDAFTYVLGHLAREIVRDGEGAGHFIEVNVSGAATKGDARILARSVISSNLVKTAFFGADANWGRILCAMGYSGATFNPDLASLWFISHAGTIQVVREGMPLAFDETQAKKILMEKDVTVKAVLGDGEEDATAWGCDLSYDYVRINGDYRS
ncbi:bifunctional glutamate N-acetyltransferase/amino-acid acetyltransferase ArgJ [Parasphaerochaeta coccoides]|uniref:Arginine biosynthesis bifunctional protein ArgJ n=1 Tax=Parasphaerochaeta coccoides (strain ATCC BAA-1237 / DSM 17374 / SPN1) TaxID=760011 RepID=F4GLD9_PARC1|nr:bifunctional glutamate N-acetyltransferase/amino-acid acetyltransferase ArgJ [Parasphaerochaeta coccoides]AEC02971.1 N-acetylglutamate synthase; glutamate N-acetyltransferase [Parasphaerochaeta coccoides DSM 17374]